MDNIEQKIGIAISSLADALGVHQRTLRIYDREGILTPIRTDKNRRYYRLCDIERAQIIVFLTRNLLLNLSGVKMILAILDDINAEHPLEYLEKIAKNAKINTQIQKNNLIKNSKRGRKKKG